MKSRILVVLAAVLASPALSYATTDAWGEFKAAHGRVYGSPEEEALRLKVFARNLNIIRSHNAEFEAGRSTYKLGVTKFADLTNEEFRELMLSSRPRVVNTTRVGKTSGSTIRPDSFDWRDQGVPIRIRDQGQFGDSWTIATTSSLADGLFIATGDSVTLSNQNLRDCVSFPSVIGALEYVRDHGIADEKSYPDHTDKGPCKVTPIRATVKEIIEVKDGDEDALADGLLENPAAVEIDAGHASFQLYVSGIYDDPQCSSTQIDHAVLLVGYGSSQDTEYWTLANSWGTAWGESGFMRMRRGVNRCGIASYAGVPIGVHSA